MPIRFACPECKQLLGVTARKAGSQVKCPKCGAAVTVPPADSAERSVAETGISRFETPEIEETLGRLVVYDRTPEGVTPAGKSAVAAPRLAGDERETLLISRAVIYFQAVLLAVVAVLFFLAGLWIGGNGGATNAPREGGSGGPVPVDVLLQYRREDGQVRPDDGAIVLVLPAGLRVTDKLSADSLKHGAPPPNAASQVIEKLNFLGGAYGRTDASGKIAGLIVPRSGKHHVLLISNHTRRPGGAEPRPEDLAALGSYVDGATELLGDRQYRLTTEELAGEVRVTHEFGE